MSKSLSRHSSFTTSDLVLDLCNPIINIFNANLFIYQRSVVNEKEKIVKSNAYLCSNGEVLDLILSLPKKNREPAKYDYSKNRKYILMDYTQPIFASMLREKFNINYVISRDERVKDNEWEHFIIGSASSGIAIVNTYINNIDLLDKFVSYFRSKAVKVIDKACNNCFASGRSIEKYSFAVFNDSPVISSQKLSIIPEPKHYYLTNPKFERILVPQAEMRYLIMLSQGRTAKEIAAAFGVSPRTVENNFRIAKYRLRCNTKGELLTIIEEWKKSNAWVL